MSPPELHHSATLLQWRRDNPAVWLLVVATGASFIALGTAAAPLLVLLLGISAKKLGLRRGILWIGLAVLVEIAVFTAGTSITLSNAGQLIVDLALVGAAGAVASAAVWSVAHSHVIVHDRAQRMERAREYARRVVEAMGDAVVVADDRANIVQINQATLQLLRTAEDSLIGQQAGEVLGTIVEQAARQPRGEGIVRGIPVRWACALVVDDRGRPLRVYVLNDDRTRILAEQRSLLAVRAAEAANEGKARFLSNMSHEIRTPLNAVIGYAELLAERLGDNPSAGDALRICEAADHLMTLLGSVLDPSNIGNEHIEIVSTPQDLPALARTSLLTVNPLAQRRGNMLHLRQETGSIPALGDGRLIRQILLNLLSNAIKFTENGRIEVVIAPNERGMTLSVSDSGVGIAADKLDQLFQPFVQIDPSATVIGTGLGLTLARRFAESMQGELSVQSQLGIGTTFTLLLPVAP